MNSVERQTNSPRYALYSAAARGDGRLRRWSGRGLMAIAAVLSPFVWQPGRVLAEDVPLARCNIQTTAAGGGSAMGMSSPSMADAGLTDNYRRALGGDWTVPREVDRNDARIRLLLLTGSGPLLIDLSVYVDGLPFREHQERWIDEALAGASSSDEKSKSEPPATEGDEKSSQDADAEETDAEETDAEETDAVEAVAPRTPEALQPRDRLARFLKRSGPETSRAEARWLLAQWVPGPSLLELTPGFAAERIDAAPVWEALDTDADGRLTDDELSAIAGRLRSCDANEDEWVDLSELQTAARSAGKDKAEESVSVRSDSHPGTGPCRLVVLSPETDWGRLQGELLERYGDVLSLSSTATRQMSRLLSSLQAADVTMLASADLRGLPSIPADVAVEVRFGEDAQAGLAVLRLGDHLRPSDEPLHAAEDVVTLMLEELDIELSAVAASSDGKVNGQVSVGAVVDGYPLLRFLDADGDRRLSLREVDAARDQIAGFDREQDGVIHRSEVPVPVRLVVAAGPYAHVPLGSPVGASARRTRSQTSPAPDWFASMDENGDKDLSLSEFLGTRQQFDRLDRNADGRISAAEATDANNSP